MVSNPFKSSVQTGTQTGAQVQFRTRLRTQLKARLRNRRNKWFVLWFIGFAVALLIGLGLLAVTRTTPNLISNLVPNRTAVSVVDDAIVNDPVIDDTNTDVAIVDNTVVDEAIVDTGGQPSIVRPVVIQPAEEESKQESEQDSEQNNEPISEVLPTEIALNIPFTSQAPHANWNLPYQEACEEASVLMAARFLLGRTIDGPNDADAAILELVNFNTDQLGQPIDTTAAETARIIEEFYDLDTEVIYDFSWEDVKHALVAGYPVILPAAGQQLGNPNFTAPGPRYHMLVIKGYTPDHVITNDPGTRNGKDYIYKYDTLYTAAHDWNNGAVESGRKAIIIVKPSVLPAGQ